MQQLCMHHASLGADFFPVWMSHKKRSREKARFITKCSTSLLYQNILHSYVDGNAREETFIALFISPLFDIISLCHHLTSLIIICSFCFTTTTYGKDAQTL